MEVVLHCLVPSLPRFQLLLKTVKVILHLVVDVHLGALEFLLQLGRAGRRPQGRSVGRRVIVVHVQVWVGAGRVQGVELASVGIRRVATKDRSTALSSAQVYLRHHSHFTLSVGHASHLDVLISIGCFEFAHGLIKAGGGSHMLQRRHIRICDSLLLKLVDILKLDEILLSFLDVVLVV